MAKMLKENFKKLAEKYGGPYCVIKRGLERSIVASIMRGSDISVERAYKVAKFFGVSMEYLLAGDESESLPGEPVPPPRGKIPVLTLAKGGRDGFYNEHGYPTGEGHRKVNRPYDLKDPHAYAVEVRGDSMAPKYEEGDIVIVSPVKPVASGDFVVLKTEDDEVMIKRIVFKGRLAILESINPIEATIVVEKKKIRFMHKIVWVKPKR